MVTYEGAVPEPDKVGFAFGEDCRPLMKDPYIREVDVTDGKLKNAFVYVMTGLPAGVDYPVPSEPKVVDNKGCSFSPNVFGVRRGQPIELLNSDTVTHSFHSFAKDSVFNVALPAKGQRMRKTFQTAQAMALLVCDIHPWMHSFVGVLDHPFFDTTDASGAFKLEKVPAGRYTLEFWHQTMGTKRAEVMVRPGEVARVTIAYGATDLPPAGTRPRVRARTSPLGWSGAEAWTTH